MIATNQNDIQGLREAGKILSAVRTEVAGLVRPGISTADLDIAAEKAIERHGARAAFLGYKQQDSTYPFPAVGCISVNDEVVHGIPREDRILKEGDVVSVDLGLEYKGFFMDSAVTVCAGVGDKNAKKLLAATEEALYAAIAAARPGKHVGDIGAAVMEVARRNNFSVVEDLGGHGIGRVLHEPPYIPNEGNPGEGEELVEGLVLAIEPMLTEGSPKITLDKNDQWTYRMKDGLRAAHFEHTVLITKKGAEVLTK